MSEDEVGSVGEEAAKLFTALSGWAREQGVSPGSAGDAVQGLAASVADLAREVDAHVATGDDTCRYCPLCQVIHAVRGTNPEVRGHLASAASSLMHAAAGLLATETPSSDRGGPVQKIDLGAAGEPWDDPAVEEEP